MVALAFPRFKALQVRVFSKNASVAVHGGLPTDAVYTQVFEKNSVAILSIMKTAT
jgi:hypothetical protein